MDGENALYVAIALESIKMNEIVKQEVAKNGVARQYSPSFIISITEFLKKAISWLEVFVNASGIIICPNKGEEKAKTSTNSRSWRFGDP